MSNQSKTHHFVPQFYQRGFSADNGDLFGYKKSFGSIKTWNTAQILYKEGLYTISFAREKTSMIEDFYSCIEGQFSNYIKLLRENIDNPTYIQAMFDTKEFVKLMKVIVSFQFWRTPNKKKLALELSSELLEHYDSANDEIKKILGYDRKFLKFLMRRAAKDDSIKVIQFFLLPLLTFDLSESFGNIRFFASINGIPLFSSDEPVIYDDIKKLFAFESVLFPVSKEVLLFASEKEFPSLDINKVNNIIAQRANEMVICSSREQLEQLKFHKSIQPTAKKSPSANPTKLNQDKTGKKNNV